MSNSRTSWTSLRTNCPYFMDAPLDKNCFTDGSGHNLRAADAFLSGNRTSWTPGGGQIGVLRGRDFGQKRLPARRLYHLAILSRRRTSLPAGRTKSRTSWTPLLDKKAAHQLIHSPWPRFCPNRTSWTLGRTSFRPSRTSFRPCRTSLPKVSDNFRNPLRFAHLKLL